MNNQPTLSIQKIIFIVVFICASIMTSLILYHLKHQTSKTAIALDNGTLFPVAQDIKAFDLVAANHEKFTQKDLLGHWNLVFFGFTHCSSVCPTTLTMLASIYEQLHKEVPNLQVVLVSLDPERDTPDALAQYTKNFHPAFIGASGNLQELRKLQSQFKIYSSVDTASGQNYQIQHTSSIMLVNPKGQWVGLFHYGTPPKVFAKEVSNSIHTLS